MRVIPIWGASGPCEPEPGKGHKARPGDLPQASPMKLSPPGRVADPEHDSSCDMET